MMSSLSVSIAVLALAASTASSHASQQPDYDDAQHFRTTLARFLAGDPVQFSPERPDMFNRYSYSANDPINFLDPDGRETVYFGMEVEAASGVGVGGTKGKFVHRSPSSGKFYSGRFTTVKGALGFAGGVAGVVGYVPGELSSFTGRSVTTEVGIGPGAVEFGATANGSGTASDDVLVGGVELGVSFIPVNAHVGISYTWTEGMTEIEPAEGNRIMQLWYSSIGGSGTQDDHSDNKSTQTSSGFNSAQGGWTGADNLGSCKPGVFEIGC